MQLSSISAAMELNALMWMAHGNQRRSQHESRPPRRPLLKLCAFYVNMIMSTVALKAVHQVWDPAPPTWKTTNLASQRLWQLQSCNLSCLTSSLGISPCCEHRQTAGDLVSSCTLNIVLTLFGPSNDSIGILAIHLQMHWPISLWPDQPRPPWLMLLGSTNA